MPTPFMHLAFAQRVIDDSALPMAYRETLTAPENWGAFLLGSVAPDARVSSGIRRADTHFFEYTPTIPVPPFTVMLERFPDCHRTIGDSCQSPNTARIAAFWKSGVRTTTDALTTWRRSDEQYE